MLSAIFSTVVTTAVRSNDLVNRTFNVVINGMSAAEHISIAIDKRSEIYGKGLIEGGILSERETLLKQKMRLSILEAQELAARTHKPVTAKPTKPAVRKKVAAKTAKPNGVKHVPQPVDVV
jgi:hypothetical protein